MVRPAMDLALSLLLLVAHDPISAVDDPLIVEGRNCRVLLAEARRASFRERLESPIDILPLTQDQIYFLKSRGVKRIELIEKYTVAELVWQFNLPAPLANQISDVLESLGLTLEKDRQALIDQWKAYPKKYAKTVPLAHFITDTDLAAEFKRAGILTVGALSAADLTKNNFTTQAMIDFKKDLGLEAAEPRVPAATAEISARHPSLPYLKAWRQLDREAQLKFPLNQLALPTYFQIMVQETRLDTVQELLNYTFSDHQLSEIKRRSRVTVNNLKNRIAELCAALQGDLKPSSP